MWWCLRLGELVRDGRYRGNVSTAKSQCSLAANSGETENNGEHASWFDKLVGRPDGRGGASERIELLLRSGPYSYYLPFTRRRRAEKNRGEGEFFFTHSRSVPLTQLGWSSGGYGVVLRHRNETMADLPEMAHHECLVTKKSSPNASKPWKKCKLQKRWLVTRGCYVDYCECAPVERTAASRRRAHHLRALSSCLRSRASARAHHTRGHSLARTTACSHPRRCLSKARQGQAQGELRPAAPIAGGSRSRDGPDGARVRRRGPLPQPPHLPRLSAPGAAPNHPTDLDEHHPGAGAAQGVAGGRAAGGAGGGA